MNEENVKGKILLPFLSDLGFDESEVFLEKSFSIRLGKSQIKTGRSDVLCKRNGKNLFIIELKSDSVPIDQKDIDQGISYARLLEDNIAPFTIITNGKVTKIFDSISKEELTGTKISEKSSFWKNGCTLSLDIDLRIRYEAYFLYMKDSDVLKWGCLGYNTSKDDQTKIAFKQFQSWSKAHEEDEIGTLHGFSFDRLLHNNYDDIVKTIDHMNTPKVDEFCVLRNWIYKFLNRDMTELFNKNIE